MNTIFSIIGRPNIKPLLPLQVWFCPDYPKKKPRGVGWTTLNAPFPLKNQRFWQNKLTKLLCSLWRTLYVFSYPFFAPFSTWCQIPYFYSDPHPPPPIWLVIAPLILGRTWYRFLTRFLPRIYAQWSTRWFGGSSHFGPVGGGELSFCIKDARPTRGGGSTISRHLLLFVKELYCLTWAHEGEGSKIPDFLDGCPLNHG